jgi:phage terminase large subunit-like protein
MMATSASSISKAVRPDWVFDDSPIDDPLGRGDLMVRFMRALKHPKSTAPGLNFQLDSPFERIVRAIYGPRNPDGTRIIRTVAIMMPRGNRKTSLAAALALGHTMGPESRAGGECLVAASDRSQARIAYKEAYGILESTPGVVGKLRLTDSKNTIRNPKNGAFFEAISSDGRVAHGHTPVLAICDEIHAWTKRDLWEAIKSGLVKVPNSLLLVISTAGRGQENLAWEFYDYARKVARGEVIDPTWLPILFEADRDADWLDEDVWHAVNPGMAYGYPDIVGMRQLAREAQLIPAEREAFKQLNLNIWLDRSTDPFVDMMVYDEGKGAVDLDDLEADRTPCWLAVDLSAVRDLTCVLACWPVGDEFQVWPWFFCPEDRLREKSEQDGVPYLQWAEEGFIIPIPGPVIDQRVIEDHIRELCARFNVQEIGFDPHLANVMLSNLVEDGLPAIEMRQSWAILAPAINDLERVIIGKRLRHGAHPVLRWNVDNVAVVTDRAGNRMFHKAKSRDRIDGAVALAMAVSRAVAGNSEVSSYETFDGNIEEWAFA